jgi:hypothetical protein
VKKTISCALFALLVLALSGSTLSYAKDNVPQTEAQKQSQRAAKSYNKQLKKTQKSQSKAMKKQMKDWKKNHPTITTT